MVIGPRVHKYMGHDSKVLVCQQVVYSSEKQKM